MYTVNMYSSYPHTNNVFINDILHLYYYFIFPTKQEKYITNLNHPLAILL